jgi:hypothetical protein
MTGITTAKTGTLDLFKKLPGCFSKLSKAHHFYVEAFFEVTRAIKDKFLNGF